VHPRFAPANVRTAASLLAPNVTLIELTIDPAAPTESHPARVHGESSVRGWGDGIATVASSCDAVVGCTTLLVVHVETSVTGFQDVSTIGVEPLVAMPTAQDDSVEVVTTSTPSLVNIHTELEPTTQERVAEASQTPGTIPMQPGDTPTPNEPQATSTPSYLLLDIVSRIGIPVSSTGVGSNPSDHSLPTTAETGPGDESGPSQSNANVQSQQATEAGPGPSTSPPESVPVVTAGGEITLGSAVLTLTPGLSSVLGDGATATYIAITTDAGGQTFITVSSSGTAVTATITDAPATLTKARTALEASITTAARPSIVDGTSADASAYARTDRAAVSTSSQGTAAPRRSKLGRWLYAGVGLVGLGLVAG
jgi:hypothetical protein